MPVRGSRLEFSRAVLSEAPDAPGVYALLEGETVVFYGSAFGGTITLRSCLAEHFFGLRPLGKHTATHCCWEISLDPVARERELLEEHRMQHGRPPRLNQA
jgi:hypothetical protein